MLDTLNPWGALRRARREIAQLEEDRNDYMACYKEAYEHNNKLKAQIAQGHFRNPETGRIGPKGETFGG